MSGLYEYRDMMDDITGIYHLTGSGLFIYVHCGKISLHVQIKISN